MSASLNHDLAFLHQVRQFVEVLSATLMGYFSSAGWAVRHKADNSPVSEADEQAQEIIEVYLEKWLPGLPILSEERPLPDFHTRASWQQYWLVDPLDGTREFIAKRLEFSVNIALVEGGVPVWGLLLMPALGHFFIGGPKSGVLFGSLGQDISQYVRIQADVVQARILNQANLGVAASRHYGRQAVEAFCDDIPSAELEVSGSAVKFAQMVKGLVAVYPRFTPVCEWDLAAGHALLAGVGGAVIDTEGNPWTYNKRERLDQVVFLALTNAASLERYFTLWKKYLLSF